MIGLPIILLSKISSKYVHFDSTNFIITISIAVLLFHCTSDFILQFIFKTETNEHIKTPFFILPLYLFEYTHL